MLNKKIKLSWYDKMTLSTLECSIDPIYHSLSFKIAGQTQ